MNKKHLIHLAFTTKILNTDAICTTIEPEKIKCHCFQQYYRYHFFCSFNEIFFIHAFFSFNEGKLFFNFITYFNNSPLINKKRTELNVVCILSNSCCIMFGCAYFYRVWCANTHVFIDIIHIYVRTAKGSVIEKGVHRTIHMQLGFSLKEWISLSLLSIW